MTLTTIKGYIEDAWRRHTAAPFFPGFVTWGRKSKPILFSDPAFGEGILGHIFKTNMKNISDNHTKKHKQS
jgi:hypothetical protein